MAADYGEVEAPVIDASPKHNVEPFPLTDDHRMLLQIRDTLYEGSWEDFVHDLRARAEGRPHVFELVPVSEQMLSTIASHLAMIEVMQSWEAAHGRILRAVDGTGRFV